MQVLGINEDLWNIVRGVGSETWKGCEWVELLVVWTLFSGSGMIFLISLYLPMKSHKNVYILLSHSKQDTTQAHLVPTLDDTCNSDALRRNLGAR